MSIYLIIGLLGLALMVASLLLGDLLDGLFDFGDGYLSGPAVAVFLTAFGFSAALADASGWETFATLGAGLAGGVLFGGIAGVATHALLKMKTDATPGTGDLLGLSGIVVTPIAKDGVGEVSLKLGGVPTKVSARSEKELSAGTQVSVTEVFSPTTVFVIELEDNKEATPEP